MPGAGTSPKLVEPSHNPGNEIHYEDMTEYTQGGAVLPVCEDNNVTGITLSCN